MIIRFLRCVIPLGQRDACHLNAERGHVREIILWHRRHTKRVDGILFKGPWRGKKRQMGPVDACGEEQGLLPRVRSHDFIHILNGVLIGLFIRIMLAPIKIPFSTGIAVVIHMRLLRVELRLSGRLQLIKGIERGIVLLFGSSFSMGKDLARPNRGVSIVLESLRQGDDVRKHLTPRIRVVVDPTGRRPQTGEGRGARGIARG